MILVCVDVTMFGRRSVPYGRDIGVVFMGYLDELPQLVFLEERERAPGELDTVDLMRHAGLG